MKKELITYLFILFVWSLYSQVSEEYTKLAIEHSFENVSTSGNYYYKYPIQYTLYNDSRTIHFEGKNYQAPLMYPPSINGMMSLSISNDGRQSLSNKLCKYCHEYDYYQNLNAYSDFKALRLFISSTDHKFSISNFIKMDSVAKRMTPILSNLEYLEVNIVNINAQTLSFLRNISVSTKNLLIIFNYDPVVNESYNLIDIFQNTTSIHADTVIIRYRNIEAEMKTKQKMNTLFKNAKAVSISIRDININNLLNNTNAEAINIRTYDVVNETQYINIENLPKKFSYTNYPTDKDSWFFHYKYLKPTLVFEGDFNSNTEHIYINELYGIKNLNIEKFSILRTLAITGYEELTNINLRNSKNLKLVVRRMKGLKLVKIEKFGERKIFHTFYKNEYRDINDIFNDRTQFINKFKVSKQDLHYLFIPNQGDVITADIRTTKNDLYLIPSQKNKN